LSSYQDEICLHQLGKLKYCPRAPWRWS